MQSKMTGVCRRCYIRLENPEKIKVGQHLPQISFNRGAYGHTVNINMFSKALTVIFRPRHGAHVLTVSCVEVSAFAHPLLPTVRENPLLKSMTCLRKQTARKRKGRLNRERCGFLYLTFPLRTTSATEKECSQK